VVARGADGVWAAASQMILQRSLAAVLVFP